MPASFYGDVSGEESQRLTFFMYEEIDAFRRAAAATGLGPADIEDVFYNKGMRLVEEAFRSRLLWG